MAIRQGTGTIRRRNAKNFIQEQAQARMDEVVRPYQQQGLNALGVDSFEVNYFKVTRSSQTCTCKQVESDRVNRPSEPDTALPPTMQRLESKLDQEVTIDYNRPLFGFVSEPKVDYEDEIEEDDLSIVDDVEDNRGILAVDQLLASSAECGICYKQGFIPGYSQYGYERRVLTNYDLDSFYGYQLDQASAPNAFVQVDPRQGLVSFIVQVPKYFKRVYFSVRDNTDVIPEEQLYDLDGNVLTHATLQASAGQDCYVVVKAQRFTHVVLDFDQGTDRVRANLAQGTKTLDWSQFDTFGSIQLILPMTIPEITVADIVYVAAKAMTFKVTDVNFLRTAKGENLDWQVSVRVIQPSESLKAISKSYKMY